MYRSMRCKEACFAKSSIASPITIGADKFATTAIMAEINDNPIRTFDRQTRHSKRFIIDFVVMMHPSQFVVSYKFHGIHHMYHITVDEFHCLLNSHHVILGYDHNSIRFQHVVKQ